MPTAGLRGLRRAPRHPELLLSAHRAADPAPPPPTGDVSHGITQWGMDGNDKYGDCGPAMSDHYMVAKTGNASLINQLGGIGPVPLYFEYGTAQGESGAKPDQGVDNPTWFTFLMNKGIIDAWAELPITTNEIQAGMNNFSGVCIAVDLPSNAEQQFNNGQPWSIGDGESPSPSGGHDILLVKYDQNGYTFVTWGSLEPATAQWDSACIQNAYVFVSKEDAENNGVNLQSLISAIQQLGGTVSPGAQPPPSPAPPPSNGS